MKKCNISENQAFLYFERAKRRSMMNIQNLVDQPMPLTDKANLAVR